MNYNINYIFRLVDNFSGGAMGMAGAMGRVTAASKAMGAGMAAAAAGGAMVTMMSRATKEAAKFEDKMAEVRKVIPGTSKDKMWEIGDQVMKLAAWSGEKKANIAEIFAAGARMGIHDTAALEKFATTVTKVKVAWDGVSSTLAGEAMGRIADQFYGNLKPTEAQDRMVSVADGINYLGQTIAGAKPLEMLKFFQRSGSIFKNTGISAQEATAWAATAISAGTSGSLEGTQASAGIWRMMTKARERKRAPGWGMLGFSLKDFDATVKKDGRVAGMLKLMEKMDETTTRVGPEKAIGGLATILGDQRAARQLSAMSGQINKFKLGLASTDLEWTKKMLADEKFVKWMNETRPDLLKKMRELLPTGKVLADGSVDQEFRDRMDSLIQQTNRMSEAWSNLLVEIGKPMLPPLTSMASGMAERLEGIRDIIKSNPSFMAPLAIGLGGAVAAAVAKGLWKGLMAPGVTKPTPMLRAMLGLGAAVPLLIRLSVVATGFAAAYWIYDNWSKLKAYAADPIKFSVLWDADSVPAWIRTLMDPNENSGGANVKDMNRPGHLGMHALEKLFEDNILQVLAGTTMRQYINDLRERGLVPMMGSPVTDLGVKSSDIQAALYGRAAVKDPFLRHPFSERGYSPNESSWADGTSANMQRAFNDANSMITTLDRVGAVFSQTGFLLSQNYVGPQVPQVPQVPANAYPWGDRASIEGAQIVTSIKQIGDSLLLTASEISRNMAIPPAGDNQWNGRDSVNGAQIAASIKQIGDSLLLSASEIHRNMAIPPAGDNQWNGRDSVNGAQLAASIPQSVAVTVANEVKIQNGTMSGHFTIDASGMARPVNTSAPIAGEASRGQATVGGSGTGMSAPNPSNM